MFINRLSITQRLGILIGFSLVFFLSFALFALWTLDKARIKGEAYDEIIQGKDLIADILPPPLYQLELLSSLQSMAMNPQRPDLPQLEKRVDSIYRNTQEREAFWKTQTLSPEIRQQLEITQTQSHQLFQIYQQKFTPCLKSHNQRCLIQVMNQDIEPLFQSHQSSIALLVQSSQSHNLKVEEQVSLLLRQSSTWMYLGMGLGITVLIGLGLQIALGIRKNLQMLKSQSDLLALHVSQKDFSHRSNLQQLHTEFQPILSCTHDILQFASAPLRQMQKQSQGLQASSLKTWDISQKLQSESEQSQSRVLELKELSHNLQEQFVQAQSNMQKSVEELETISTATEEMSVTVSEIAKNTAHARILTENGHLSATKAMSNIQTLNEAASAIEEFTNVIQAISSQTNLLALNATIEAARAGGAGKGFAVVAHEIKELAKQSSTSAEDIRKKVNGIQSEIQNTNQIVHEISNSMFSVNENVTIIATAVEEQSVTTREIAHSLQRVSEGVRSTHAGMLHGAELLEPFQRSIAGTQAQAEQVGQLSQILGEDAQTLLHTIQDHDRELQSFQIES